MAEQQNTDANTKNAAKPSSPATSPVKRKVVSLATATGIGAVAGLGVGGAQLGFEAALGELELKKPEPLVAPDMSGAVASQEPAPIDLQAAENFPADTTVETMLPTVPQQVNTLPPVSASSQPQPSAKDEAPGPIAEALWKIPAMVPDVLTPNPEAQTVSNKLIVPTTLGGMVGFGLAAFRKRELTEEEQARKTLAGKLKTWHDHRRLKHTFASRAEQPEEEQGQGGGRGA